MRKATGILRHVILIGYLAIILYPLLFIFNSSFKNNSEVVLHPWALPEKFQIGNYIDAFGNSHIGKYFMNSLYISTIATVAGIVLATAIAYAITRMRFPRISKLVYGGLLLSLLISPASLLIPLYIMIRSLGIYNTPFALIVPYTAFSIPISVFVMAAFLKSIPRELEEAGVMDGLSVFGLLGRIIMPLTLPTLVTVFILNFMGHWNEFIMANLFLSSQDLRTLPVAVVAFMDKFQMNYGALTASVMISALPVIIVYTVLQKQIIQGVAAGSVKG
ncbi:putative ABC transporter permease protein YurM [Paenibacillus marchantiophytorum]|uniref:ABC transporter permease protein YurM n=1 Tax=Paenibacillus marchantiophytorum TaxID=1619310 RepID=A0ABQ1FJ07_9BACL|nr:carbohydrate ABC transporter permease [Paenibacillus marchantiophytorum]GGA13351.1 putative ABC transporter permease protein YurM [Paenibacillus marchantiophytorum]